MTEPSEIWNAILDMGGVTSVLHNLSPAGTSKPVPWSSLRATAAAIQEVGDLESARILTELAVRFESAPHGGASTWEDFLGASCPSDLAHEATQILEQRGPNLWELLEEFTASHGDLNIP